MPGQFPHGRGFLGPQGLGGGRTLALGGLVALVAGLIALTGSASNPASAQLATSPETTGPTLVVGPAGLTGGLVSVPLSAVAAPGSSPYSGFQVHLRWDPLAFAFAGASTTGSVLSHPLCASPSLDSDGGGVRYDCIGDSPAAPASGLLATILLSPRSGCSLLHLVTLGAPDDGGVVSGSYTISSQSPFIQTNSYADGSTCTASPSPTPTSTATNTPVPTATATATGTPTATATATATFTPTFTATATATDTPAPTATPVPTNTDTPTATASPIPTASPLPTDSPTSTPTALPVATSTPFPPGPPIMITVVDPGDTGTCSANNCDLRGAINLANAHPGSTIQFNIPGAGAHTIAPASALPAITASVTLDATTQPGFTGAPLIEIDGAGAGSANGLSVSGGSAVLRGLVINRFALYGVELTGSSSNSRVEGSYIGTDGSGTTALGNASGGILIADGGGSTIGGTTIAARNVISGNGGSGVALRARTVVQGDYIGTQADGHTALANSGDGIAAAAGSDGSIIGGSVVGQSDIVAFNGGAGVSVTSASTVKIGVNSIHDNVGAGILLAAGANGGIAPPAVTGATAGSACAGCTVDIYSDNAGQGRIYDGSTTAGASGGWSFAGTVAGPNITTTATDATGNTSAFSTPFTILMKTVAGTGVAGFSGDGGPASAAQLNEPRGMYETSGQVLYFADTANNRIRSVTPAQALPGQPTPVITTVVGGGSGCVAQTDALGDGCAPTEAILAGPVDVFVDISGAIVVADTGNCRIRKAVPGGTITTIAGTGVCGYNGDGIAATGAQLNAPRGVVVDVVGNVFIADTLNNRVRRIDATTGAITTFAGTGIAGFSGDGGPASLAQLNQPYDVAISPTNRLLIADWGNNRIRGVDLMTSVINTIAGNGVAGFSGDGGLATAAELNGPEAVAADKFGNVFLADTQNDRIRMVNFITGEIATFAGGGTQSPPAPPLQLQLHHPAGVSTGSVNTSDTGSSTTLTASCNCDSTGQPQPGYASGSCSHGASKPGDTALVVLPLGLVLGRKRFGRMLSVLLATIRRALPALAPGPA